jgi:alkylhydroperoxidase family enzyme
LVAAVLDDLESAPVDERLRGTLRVLAKLTLEPAAFGPGDVAEVRALGVSDAAIADAVLVCALFNIATRCADALAFDVSTVNPAALARFGYAPPPAAPAPSPAPPS